MNIDRIERILTEAVESWLAEPDHALMTGDFGPNLINGYDCHCLVSCIPFDEEIEDVTDAAETTLGLTYSEVWDIINGFDSVPPTEDTDRELYALGAKFRVKYADRIIE